MDISAGLEIGHLKKNSLKESQNSRKKLKLKEKTQTQEINFQKIKQKAQFSLFFFTEPLILCSKTFRYSSFRYSVNKKPRRRFFSGIIVNSGI